MTFFLNAIIDLRHPEEARSAVSKDAHFCIGAGLPKDAETDRLGIQDDHSSKFCRLHGITAQLANFTLFEPDIFE